MDETAVVSGEGSHALGDPACVAAGESAYADRIGAYRIALMARHMLVIFASNLAASLIFGAVVWDVVDHADVVAWVGGVFALNLVRALVFTRYRAASLSSKAGLARWTRRFLWGSAASGALWGIAALGLFPSASVPRAAFVTLLYLGMLSASVGSLAAHLPSYHAFILCALVPLIGQYLYLGGPLYYGLAAIGVVYLWINLRFVSSVNATLGENARLRFENEDISERLRERTEREAEQANVAKSKFLATASHDLRQPLHAMGLFLQSLDRRAADGEVAELVAQARCSVDVLDSLLDALLDISRLDSGVVEVHRRHFNLSGLLEGLAPDFEAAAARAGLSLELSLSPCTAYTDPLLIERIVRNLAGNAIQHAGQGTVTLALCRHEDAVSVSVRDTGPGIPESEREAIFSEFHQLANPERDRRKGFGLGLAIVRRLAALLDLDITLESTPGEGTMFSVRVPLGDEQKIVTRQGDVRPGARLDGVHVLVVDDEVGILTGMRWTLGDWGCVFHGAESEDEAVTLVDQGVVPDLLICDYRLREGRTGIEAIEALHAACGRKVPAILLTGDSAPERLREASVSHHLLLHKPVKPARLRAAVRMALSAAPS